MDTKASILATKEDIENTKEAIADWKRSIIKWMFVFWLAQIAIYGLFLLFLKK